MSHPKWSPVIPTRLYVLKGHGVFIFLFALKKVTLCSGVVVAARYKDLGRRSLSKGSLTGPWSSFLAEQLNFSVLPFAFLWKVLIEQKRSVFFEESLKNQKQVQALYSSTSLSLRSHSTLAFSSLWEWVTQGEGMEVGIYQAVLLVEVEYFVSCGFFFYF